MYSTLNKIDVDFSQEKLILSTGEQVDIETEDKVYFLSFTHKQIQELHDDYRTSIGEPTCEEQEDEILKLRQMLEDAQEQIEAQEERIEALRDKYNEGYPF